MIINISYDASVAGAPAGYKQAVQAAVQFFESTISNNITVNIDFGWGEVGGQAIEAGALAESSASLVATVSTTAAAQLPTWGSKDPGAVAAYQAMFGAGQANMEAITNASATIDPATGLGGGAFFLTLAQARALGYTNQYNIAPDAVDGTVGLDSSSTFTFDPSNRAVPGAYDAVGALEHEISEVLGRIDGLGEPLSDGTPIYTLLDFYRYSKSGQVITTPGDGSFSFDGGRNLLLPFNNPGNGGDAGDWSTAVSGDSFDAFAQPGVALTISPVDLRVIEAAGYSLTTPQDVIGSSDIVSGTSPNGTITNVGGVLTVQATVVAADALALYSYNLNFDNTGATAVSSATADAWGAWGTGSSFQFVNAAGATLSISAAHQAMGSLFSSGGSFDNAGTISVTGATAYGETGATSFNNSGTLTVIASGAGQKSVGVDIANPWALSFTNSGTINADYAFLVDEHTNVITIPGGQPVYPLSTVIITNFGQINGVIGLTDVKGQIHNTGSITRAIQFGNFDSVYDGASGTQSGGIYLGSGTNMVTLGGDGEAVFGGGYADTITGGAGNDFIEIARGNNGIDGGGGFNILSFADSDVGATVDLGAGTAVAGGADTVRNIQEVIGSNFGDTLKAGASGAELVGGSGNDTLIGGAGNDTLVAGTGGATMTGGGGNNTFVYAIGDHQLVIADFGANGDNDVLDIYGYAAALSVQQQGADTLVTLSAGDSVLLKGVQASSLTAGNLIYKAGNFATSPTEPAGPPVFGTAPIEFTHDLTVAAGEVLNEADVPVALTDSTLIAGGSVFHSFDNKGTVKVSTNNGDVIGLLTDLSAAGGVGSGTIPAGTFANEGGAVFSVIDSSATGTAYGFDTGHTPAITNAGTLTVSANGVAYGAWLGDSPTTFTNTAAGVIRAQSSGAAAYGLFFDAGCQFTNNGQIIAAGVGKACGVEVTQAQASSFVNNGSIIATATGPGAQSIGIDLQIYAGRSMAVSNTGSIAADIALAMPLAGWTAPLTLSNSGTITGAIDLQVGAVAETITNTGHIVGAINFGAGTNVFNGAGGSQVDGIYLGSGTGTVTLGNDGEQVFSKGGTATITGGAGNDSVEINGGRVTYDGGGGNDSIAIAGDNAVVSVHGTNAAVQATGSGDSLTIGGNGQYAVTSDRIDAALASSFTVHEDDGSRVDITGSGLAVTLGTADTLGVFGSVETVSATGTGDVIWIGANGQSAAVSDTVSLAQGGSLTEVDGSRVDAYGSGVATAIGNVGTLGIFGSADTVTASGTGDIVWIGGNGQSATVTDLVELAQGGTIHESDASRVDVYGSGTKAAIGNSDTLGIFGSSETVTATGTGGIVWVGGNGQDAAASDLVTLSQGGTIHESDASRVDVYGSGASATIGNSDTLGIFGSSETVTATGTGDVVWIGGNGQNAAATDFATLSQGGTVHESDASRVDVVGNNASILLGANDTLGAYGSGDGFSFGQAIGHASLWGFGAGDQMTLAKSSFAGAGAGFDYWAYLLNHSSVSGGTTTITLDANDTIVLNNFTLSSAAQSQVHFV